MGMMSVHHPDILKFLYAKQDLKAFVNFNISVKINDEWMKKVLKSSKVPHEVINPRTGQRYLIPRGIDVKNYTIDRLYPVGRGNPAASDKGKFYSITDIWKVIIQCPHRTSEPGLVFMDRINRDNPTPSLGEIEATNPCGEQPLLPYEACTLGSINLSKFVTAAGSSRADIDWKNLARTVKLSVRFLDNIIDACIYPVRDTSRLAQANRKIGLGVMGLADCFFLLGIAYDSHKAVEFGEKIMRFINENARQASSNLADLKGAFPNWDKSIWKTERKKKVRNASITCAAPTGTISIIADCSSGIQPLYSLAFLRNVLNGSRLLQINPIFKKAAQQRGFYSQNMEKQILKSGSIQSMKAVPAHLRRIFKCAYDISPQQHIRMQAAFQRHCDAAVSKTINLEQNAPPAAVEETYKLAYRLGCKGITIYRRGSRQNEPMAILD